MTEKTAEKYPWLQPDFDEKAEAAKARECANTKRVPVLSWLGIPTLHDSGWAEYLIFAKKHYNPPNRMAQ
ncbi:MAG: hypothetical protein ACI92I_000220 [Acidimicrobiales bacterium]|jgi:hypothetical protein